MKRERHSVNRFDARKWCRKPRVVGILNVTPDSFSDGGKYFSLSEAAARAKQMIADGVDCIDIGGESTRPGSEFVSVKEELRRIVPVVKKIVPIARKHSVLISVDTYKAEVAAAAISAGADIINDVTALRGDQKMASLIAKTGVGVVLMYAKDATPRTTRVKKRYRDVVKTVKEFLKARAAIAAAAGIHKKQIILDPGMGAFISGLPRYSIEILIRLGELLTLGYPIMLGPSRKSFLNTPLSGRQTGSLIAAFVALQNGARVIRMHDTYEAGQTRDFYQLISKNKL